MTNSRTLIARAYAAFNARDITAALALMSEHVSWPKASEGGRVIGKDQIRAYWTRQWSQFDPRVEPRAFIDRGAGTIEVRVHQVVKSLDGHVLSDSEVGHTYSLSNGLIDRMDLTGDAAAETASSAFSAH